MTIIDKFNIIGDLIKRSAISNQDVSSEEALIWSERERGCCEWQILSKL